jgi:hypothetical protein
MAGFLLMAAVFIVIHPKTNLTVLVIILPAEEESNTLIGRPSVVAPSGVTDPR